MKPGALSPTTVSITASSGADMHEEQPAPALPPRAPRRSTKADCERTAHGVAVFRELAAGALVKGRALCCSKILAIALLS